MARGCAPGFWGWHPGPAGSVIMELGRGLRRCRVAGRIGGVPGRYPAFDDPVEQIVTALVEDARTTYAESGTRVGLSAPAVKWRVDRLRASGAITGFTASVDPSALGWTTEAYVELFCRGRTSPADIGAAVSNYPAVTGACT